MRDLQKDLGICQAATPGPWHLELGEHGCDWECEDPDCDEERENNCPYFRQRTGANIPEIFTIDCGDYNGLNDVDAHFIVEARNGWEEAIRRAMAAEARVKELEAQCAVMREVLEWILPGAMSVSCMYDDHEDVDPNFHCCDWSMAVDKIRQVLSSDAGRDLLERLRKLEAAIRATCQDCVNPEWGQTIAECEYQSCPLWPYRPLEDGQDE